jgi:hypothetical protein
VSNMARPGEQRRRRNLQPTAPDREREHDAGERSQERGRAPDPGATGDGGGGRVRRRGRREWLRVGSSTRHQRARVAAEGGRRRGSSHRCGASDPSRVEKRRFSWGNTPPAAAGFSACWRVPAAAPAQRPRVPLEPADRQSLLAGRLRRACSQAQLLRARERAVPGRRFELAGVVATAQPPTAGRLAGAAGSAPDRARR